VTQAGYGDGATGLWTMLFVVSKVAELFDTVILVLKGKEPIFLHWCGLITAYLLACVCACECLCMAWRGLRRPSSSLVARRTCTSAKPTLSLSQPKPPLT
jgi:hypothetical protein